MKVLQFGQQKRVEHFMRHIGEPTSPRPTLLARGAFERRYALMEEELHEYAKAYDDGSIVEIADALGDLLYTLLGTASAHGIDMEAVFDAIHASNMTKDPDPNPDSFKRAVKGPSYEKPRIACALLEMLKPKLDLNEILSAAHAEAGE